MWSDDSSICITCTKPTALTFLFFLQVISLFFDGKPLSLLLETDQDGGTAMSRPPVEESSTIRDQGDVRKARRATSLSFGEKNDYLLCCCGLLPSSVIIFFLTPEWHKFAWRGEGGGVSLSKLIVQKKSDALHHFCYQKTANMFQTWGFDIVKWSDSLLYFASIKSQQLSSELPNCLFI